MPPKKTPAAAAEETSAPAQEKPGDHQAIQSFIRQKYPSVDQVRLKHLVRRALKSGLESGVLVRPANAAAAIGATGKFRLAPQQKEPKAENVDPNVEKTSGVKEAPKKTKTASAKKSDGGKKGDAVKDATLKGKKVAKKKPTKAEVESSSKVAPARRPKAKTSGDAGGAAEPAKVGKGRGQRASGGDDPPPKAPGKRGRAAE